MAIKKRFKTDLAISADNNYTCSISKGYNDVYTLNQELDSTDAFMTIMTSQGESSLTTTATQINAPQAILVKNVSNITAEILMVTQDWKDSSSVDVRNSIDVGGGGATAKRTWSFLLPAGEFMYLPNARAVSYSTTDDPSDGIVYQSAANAGVGDISIVPKDINSGNEYRKAAAISGTTYGAGSDVLIDGTVSDVTATTFTVDDGDYFEPEDLLILGDTPDEVVEVVSISSNVLTIKRGLLGTNAGAITNDEEVNYFFGNEYLPYNSGRCMSDKKGRFKQRGGFFGYARTSTDVASGLVAGSVAIQIGYTQGGHLDWGLNGITPSTNTGLAASTTYTFHLVVDEFGDGGIDDGSVTGETAIAFTTDASDLTFNGSVNAVLPKIQAAINTQTKTTGSGLLNKSVSIFLHNGDVRVKSNSNHSETRIGIANVSGTTPFGVGRFPSLTGGNVPDLLGSEHGAGGTDTICFGPASSLAPETIIDRVTGQSVLNENAFIFDDGQGNLRYMDNIVGSIDYVRGHCSWTLASHPEAEFKIHGQSHSAHSGGINYASGAYNSISLIKARSVNPIKNSKIEILVLG